MIPPSLNSLQPQRHTTSSPCQNPLYLYCLIKKGHSSIPSVVEKDSRKEHNYEYNKKRTAGPGIESGTHATLVRSSSTEVPRLISTVHIAPTLYNPIYTGPHSVMYGPCI